MFRKEIAAKFKRLTGCDAVDRKQVKAELEQYLRQGSDSLLLKLSAGFIPVLEANPNHTWIKWAIGVVNSEIRARSS